MLSISCDFFAMNLGRLFMVIQLVIPYIGLRCLCFLGVVPNWSDLCQDDRFISVESSHWALE